MCCVFGARTLKELRDAVKVAFWCDNAQYNMRRFVGSAEHIHKLHKAAQEPGVVYVIDWHIQGIPCQLWLYYDSWWEEVVWELHDRKGYFGKWLEDMCTTEESDELDYLAEVLYAAAQQDDHRYSVGS